MAAYLPADMITIIFSFLPVRSLLQFRSISKSWRSIIDSHDFKTLHFNKLNPILVLCDRSKLYAVDLPTLGNAVPLNKPPKFFENHIVIIGSCNGLLCIKNLIDIAIWNPSLHKLWILPRRPDSPNYSFAGSFYGFGFDSFAGDYKLLKIAYFTSHGDSFVTKVSLFSCRTNAWKILPNMPYALYWSEKMGVFVDHALHVLFGCTPPLKVWRFWNLTPIPDIDANVLRWVHKCYQEQGVSIPILMWKLWCARNRFVLHAKTTTSMIWR